MRVRDGERGSALVIRSCYAMITSTTRAGTCYPVACAMIACSRQLHLAHVILCPTGRESDREIRSGEEGGREGERERERVRHRTRERERERE